MSIQWVPQPSWWRAEAAPLLGPLLKATEEAEAGRLGLDGVAPPPQPPPPPLLKALARMTRRLRF
jgi:hypothetical protein